MKMTPGKKTAQTILSALAHIFNMQYKKCIAL